MVAERNIVFEELAQFLANLSPKKVMAFSTSAATKEHVNFLLSKNKSNGLTMEESREMEQHMLVEHIVQLAKAKALFKLSSK